MTGPEPEQRTFIENARRQQIVGAAIDTIAEVGYAQASLARIAARIGISKGVISYHFAGKDDLIKQVVIDVVEAGRAYIILPRVFAEPTGPARLRAYIESNLAFMREHRNYMVAIVEILRNGALTTDSGRRVDGRDVDVAAHLLEGQLATSRPKGNCEVTSTPASWRWRYEATIDVVPHRLVRDPGFDVEHYAKEIAAIFDLATWVAD